MRLDKFLSELGIASRKELRGIIRSGRVQVDGLAVTAPEHSVDPEKNIVCMDGTPLSYVRFRTFMLDKPAGVITATEDKKQETVLSLLPPELQRLGLFPVGRLDKDTSGLLLLTNDGELSHKIISPKHEIVKRYRARVDGIPDEADAAAFREGLVLRDGLRCLPAELEITGGDVCFVNVMEGKYHQVRRMLASRGKTVLELRRLSIGALALEAGSTPGSLRELTETDLGNIFMGNMP